MFRIFFALSRKRAHRPARRHRSKTSVPPFFSHSPMSHPQEPRALLRVLKYTGLFGGVQGFNVLMGMLRGKLTALLLSTRGAGLISAYSQAVELVGAATGMGIAFSAIQRIARLYERGDERALAHYARLVRSWVLIVGLVGMLIVALGARWWSAFYLDSPDSAGYYVAASPLVLMSAMIGGEVAILKGTRRIKSLAATSMLGALSTLLFTAVCYLTLGTVGIVPALVLSSAALLTLQLRAAHAAVPYRVQLGSWRFLRRGRAMLVLGMAYAVANVIEMAAQSGVRAFIVRHPQWAGVEGLSGLQVVGLFSVGITLTVSYSRLVFTSMDAEYYPRLSGLAHDTARQNATVNRQIDVLVLLIVPFLLMFCWALPWVVRLLYSTEFLPATQVVMGAAFHLLFKAVATPIAFLALAHARSRLYMGVEVLSSLLFVLCVSGGYFLAGLSGAGWGITLSQGLYLLLVAGAYTRSFAYRMESSTLRKLLLQGLLLVLGLTALHWQEGWLRHAGVAVALALSLAYSWHTLAHSLALSKRLRKWWQRRRKNA